ncbi:MAG: GNAT family N-acetyltransferase [Candidatus Abyssobacteria bacterium SURF_5]|uniref:GNAT family N-acetyltransferase n=1 Tax=Abyssobacteria bacterium (strain SURF_5) TaxID=2093360 RepID=A0A3A4MXW8_ABYX5|nr:MAG: GNAT family N-acetyltransferase [Candidatus Abyssubacteria bacterium SURF_5]
MRLGVFANTAKRHAERIHLTVYNPFVRFDLVEDIWTSLLGKCPHSYFLSWGWVDSWIRSLPPDCGVSLIAGFKNDSPILAFFVGSHNVIRHRLFRAGQLSLNSTLIPFFDSLCLEYNAVLIDPDITIALENMVEMIPLKNWDEFYMPRYSPVYCPNLIIRDMSRKYNLKILDRRNSYYVDLEGVRKNNMDYLALLSNNRRQQIRRTLKEYKKWGDIHVRVAGSAKDALGIFEKLVLLHQKEWKNRGQPGAFGTDYMIKFHKNLISRRFDHGEIQLMEITAGMNPIGCLYNFLYQGCVLFYQSGFSYLAKNVYRPGLVCHYHAVLHNAAKGFLLYDFLADDSQYKKSLSTDSNEMLSILVQKSRLKYKVENRIRTLYHFGQERLSMNGAGRQPRLFSLLEKLKRLKSWKKTV